MSDLNDYFDPVSIDTPSFEHLNPQAGFPHSIAIHTENSPIKKLEGFRVALFGVPESRNSVNQGTEKAPDAIRSQLYNLARIPGKLKITDLGNMKQGTTFSDTIAGLSHILTILWSEKIFPVMIGGTSALIPAIDSGFSEIKTKYSLTAVDSRISYNQEKKNTGPYSYLNSITGKQSHHLCNYTNIGYQTYLNDQQVINRFLRKGSALVRIGDVRQAINLMEPLMRDSEAIVFNIAAVRQSDAPGTMLASPNGFYGEEICLLARYAGLSDNSRVFGLFDVNPGLDSRNQTAGLAAQILWFFLEGFSQKQFETPVLGSENSGRFIRYHVRVTGLEDDFVFVKSNLTERWWMELNSEAEGTTYISCSYEDYLKANRNEVPDRWVNAMSRLKK